jgi:peptidoglycan-associated lipoprotein
MSTFRFQPNHALRLCLLATPLVLAACASQPEAIEATAEAQQTDRSVNQPTATRDTSISASADDSMPSERVIHFDFDDSSVGADYQALLVAHGRYLAEHSDASVRLEGHADERGTREYNVGLGERRASAVRQLLLLQGAHDEQIEILSFGEESPVVAGNSESSWWQNRRVEFNYLSEG